jgi:hypothetical protein
MLMRRRSDNVFLLTLVDFLIQIIFFGLFVFAVWHAVLNRGAEKRYDPQDVKDAVEQAGVSNLKELVDELSKLAPVRLKGMNDALGKDLTADEVKMVHEAIRQAGGADGLASAMQRLAKLEQGSDKPPCLFEMVNGQRRAKTLATAVGTGSTISFSGSTPELEQLLAELGLSYGRVQTLGVREFPRVFAGVLKVHPACRFTITLRETTSMVTARDAVGQIFYTRLRR